MLYAIITSVCLFVNGLDALPPSLCSILADGRISLIPIINEPMEGFMDFVVNDQFIEPKGGVL